MHRLDTSTGRVEQIVALSSAYGSASMGAGRVVLVSGEAGAGKSTLVTRLIDNIVGDDTVLIGYCDPLTTPRPAGPLIDIAAELGTSLADMLQSGQRTGLFDAVLAAIAEVSQPCVVVFEDIHWADELTLDLLAFLARRITSMPVLVVATYRPEGIPDGHAMRSWVGNLATVPTVETIAVPPLSVPEVAALSEGSGLDPRELHARTGGNAFYVSEVLSAPCTAVPARVLDSVIGRCAALSPAARRAILAAAVIGSRAEPGLLMAIEGVAATAVDECVNAGLLTFVPPMFRFRHELTRQAILAEANPLAMAAMHAAVLRVLRVFDPAQLARLAEHAERAGDVEAVLEFAPRAADRAGCLGSHREAVAQYRRALAFAGTAPADVRADLFARLSFQLYLTAQLGDALEARRAALELRDRDRQRSAAAEDLRWLSRIAWYVGDREQAEKYARLSIEWLEGDGRSAELGMAYSNQSHLLMLEGNYYESIAWGKRALDVAEHVGDVEIRIHALNNIGVSKAWLGLAEGRRLIEESLQLAREHDLEDHVARAYVNLATGIERRDGVEYDHYLDEGITFCDARALELPRGYLEAVRAMQLVNRGEWAEAESVAGELLSLTTIPVHRFLALLQLCVIHIRRGEPFSGLLGEAAAIAENINEPQLMLPVLFARAEAASLSGSLADMVDDLTGQLATIGRTQDAWRSASLHFWLSKADPSHAAPPGLCGPFGAQLTSTPREAADMWYRLNSPYQAAIALVDGDQSDVREAFAVFQRLGAVPAMRRARARLRELGVSALPRGPRASTAAHPFGLTAREDEVLQLLTRNLTNQAIAQHLFVSERTVHHHVSALLAKLDVRNRAAAAALARDIRRR